MVRVAARSDTVFLCEVLSWTEERRLHAVDDGEVAHADQRIFPKHSDAADGPYLAHLAAFFAASLSFDLAVKLSTLVDGLTVISPFENSVRRASCFNQPLR